MTKLCTVILEYQNPQMTLETIDSLRQAVLPKSVKQLIVVVDNSPVPDGSLKKALKKYKDVKLITALQNTGFADGNNLGIQRGLKWGAKYFLLINNDIIVDRQFLVQLFKAAQGGADLAVSKVYFAKGYEYHKDRYQPDELGKVIWYAGGRFDWNEVFGRHLGVDKVDTGQYNQAKIVDFVNFCCVLIKKEVFVKIGLLDPAYFLYWEDADFSHRAQLAGFRQVFVPQSRIWHKSSGSSGSGSQLHDYYITRNRLVFGFKYASLRTKFALLRQSLKQLLNGRPGEKKGVLDFYLHRLGKGSVL
ncbi:MAG: glycosyltransferase family 2 protein [Candidatus Beckwithbacteria bacterium]|nr:glycosyltransferase family 2 protein [Candidatus Beckwithbacteria bacterium]